jgi:hypothetical protein
MRRCHYRPSEARGASIPTHGQPIPTRGRPWVGAPGGRTCCKKTRPRFLQSGSMTTSCCSCRLRCFSLQPFVSGLQNYPLPCFHHLSGLRPPESWMRLWNSWDSLFSTSRISFFQLRHLSLPVRPGALEPFTYLFLNRYSESMRMWAA